MFLWLSYHPRDIVLPNYAKVRLMLTYGVCAFSSERTCPGLPGPDGGGAEWERAYPAPHRLFGHRRCSVASGLLNQGQVNSLASHRLCEQQCGCPRSDLVVSLPSN